MGLTVWSRYWRVGSELRSARDFFCGSIVERLQKGKSWIEKFFCKQMLRKLISGWKYAAFYEMKSRRFELTLLTINSAKIWSLKWFLSVRNLRKTRSVFALNFVRPFVHNRCGTRIFASAPHQGSAKFQKSLNFLSWILFLFNQLENPRLQHKLIQLIKLMVNVIGDSLGSWCKKIVACILQCILVLGDF